ncbi:MAG: T9SS type A sorting domain-containing protein, partial [Bacteroidota bacterium]|nr:T9SS type A sorting domain-containing protein [Bacteroidota bacterium]
IQKYIEHHQNDPQLKTAATLYTIPVVVHVVHTGGAVGTTYNPTDAQIQGAIAYLNNVYNGTYPGLEGVGDMQIQFALATRDTNCNIINGIDRIDGSSMPNYASNGVNATTTGGVTDSMLKSFDRWDPANYYNIWIVNKIDGKDGTSGQFIAGYAAYAGSSPLTDGTVMLATQMLSGQKTLPHEIGHALNLYHPFEGSPDAVTCPTNTTCSADGDKVCDTDPITYNQTGGVVNFSCRTGTNGCTGTAYSINTEHNFMNYTSCYTLFTAGQKSRALAAMSLQGRQTLAMSSAISSYVGPYSGPVAASCSPATNPTGLSGNFAGIMSVSLGGKVFYSSTAKIDNGYLNQTGKCLNLIQLQRGSTYTFSATVLAVNDEQLRVWIDYNNNGIFDNVTEQIYYSPQILQAGSPVTITGNFTVPLTAVLSTAIRMRVMDELSSTTYGAGFTITSGCYAPVYGQAEDYPIMLSALLPVDISAFAALRKNSDALITWKTSSEVNLRRFEVERSADGTAFAGIGTVSAGNNPSGDAYSFTDPNLGADAAYYRLKSVDADGSFTYSNVVKLDAISNSAAMRIRNNPFTDHIGIDFGSVQSGTVKVKLFDMEGRVVYMTERNLAGLNKIELNTPAKLSAGSYVIQVSTNSGSLVKKLLKQ